MPKYVNDADYQQTGQIWSINEQCKMNYGLRALPCRTSVSVCTLLYCRINETVSECFSKGPAVAGSTCDTNSVCFFKKD